MVTIRPANGYCKKNGPKRHVIKIADFNFFDKKVKSVKKHDMVMTCLFLPIRPKFEFHFLFSLSLM